MAADHSGAWARTRRALTALAVGAGIGKVGAGQADDVLRIPLRLPFAADLEGAAAGAKFKVEKEAPYAVNLTFLYDESSPEGSARARVWHLAGGSEETAVAGQWEEPGAPLVIEVSLQKTEEGAVAEVFRARVTRPRLSSWGEGTLTARLAAPRLLPGLYILLVRNLQAAPSLHDVRARIGVARAYAGK